MEFEMLRKSPEFCRLFGIGAIESLEEREAAGILLEAASA
jgi:hypothetical protein